MPSEPEHHLHPITDKILTRMDKEALLKQKATVIWLCGLSGSGKSTLANALERHLHADGFATVLLDGDNVRTGLNKGLGFSDEDRRENIRRIAEVSKLFLHTGLITINSFITPKQELRDMAREILGSDLVEVYVECSFEKCAQRDVKGLYAKAGAGEIKHFTGKDSGFEPPTAPDLTINTEEDTSEQSLQKLLDFILPKIQPITP